MPSPTPPSERALRALEDAAGQSRPRSPGDATDPAVPVAATVVLLRDGPRGPEVLLIERPDRGSFAGAWVFPGGKLEDGDRASADEPEEDAARRAAVRETREEIGLDLEPSVLGTLSVWDPPPGLPLRIRTWFFVASVPEVQLVLAADEAVAAAWIAPSEALARHGRDDMTLYPPTWVTLHALSDHRDAASVLQSARVAGVQRFETVARRGGDGPVLLWHGDADYETDAARTEAEQAEGASRARHRLEIGALPWRYTRTD